MRKFHSARVVKSSRCAVHLKGACCPFFCWNIKRRHRTPKENALHKKVRKHRSFQVVLVVHVSASAVHDAATNRNALIVHNDARVTIKVDTQPALSGKRLASRQEAHPVHCTRLDLLLVGTASLEALHCHAMRDTSKDTPMRNSFTGGLCDEANVLAVRVVDTMQFYLVGKEHTGTVALCAGAPSAAVRRCSANLKTVSIPALLHWITCR